MLKAMIFDFDGTILDTETLWYQAYKDVLKSEFQIDLPLEEFAKVIGTTDEVLYQFIEKQSKVLVKREEIEEKAHQHFHSLKSNLVLRDGVLDLIEEVNSMGLKLAIASSSKRKWIEDFLIQFQIQDYFPIIKSKDDVEKVKPNPELYLTVVSELNIQPEEAVAIEDSVNGSAAALKAGIPCIVVPNAVTRFLEFDRKVTIYKSFPDINLEEL